MAAICSACTHDARTEIDHDLLDPKTPLRVIAGKTGLSTSALDRHRYHVGQEALMASESARDARAAALWGQVQSLVERASSMLADAEAAGNTRTALCALRECRETLRFLSVLTPPGSPSEETMQIMLAFAAEIRARPMVAEAVATRLRRLDNEEAHAVARALVRSQ